VIKDDDLKFETNKELATVNIQLEKRSQDGTRRKGRSGIKDGAIKKMQIRHIVDEALLKEIAEEQRKKLVFRGYEGALTAFLVPVAEPGMSAEISDTTYAERSGSYFIEGLAGEFGEGGGRQKIHIGASL
jgi:hypothetical protein